MAESELLLQPEMLAELERYRTLEHRVQIVQRQCQEFNALVKQVEPRNTPPLSSPLRDGSPSAEFDAVFSSLRQQIVRIHQIEAQLNEQQSVLHSPPQSDQPYQPPQPRYTLFGDNMKATLYVIGGIVVFAFLLVLFYSVAH
jgi:chaperonin cofactor prefoldin